MKDLSLKTLTGTTLFGRHWPIATPRAVMALIHGFGEHSGRYAHMAAHLNAQGIAVTAVDLTGHGETAGKRGVINSYDDFRADLSALLTKTRDLYPDTPLILYGHSMGGGIVLDHGLAGLDAMPIIASAPLIAPAKPVPSALRVIVRLMAKFRPKGVMSNAIDGTKISNLPEEQLRYMDDPLNHGQLGLKLAVDLVDTGESIAKAAEHWDRPLLLFHSKADQLTSFASSEAFAKKAKQVLFHAYETSQHEMHNNKIRDEIYSLMTDFILQHSQPETA